MGTAVLSGKADVLAGVGKEVRSIKEDSPDKKNFWEDLAYRLRLKGHGAVAVCDGDGGGGLEKYFNPETGRVLLPPKPVQITLDYQS
jgi:hypothetical protein